MQVDILTPAQLAARETGCDIAVVIDVFRATSTACVLGARNPTNLLLVPRVDVLSSLPEDGTNYLVFSELKCPDHDQTDNSPNVAKSIDLQDRTPVLVTTNGTKTVEIAAGKSDEIWLASFLNVAETARAIREGGYTSVALVPAGKVSNDTRTAEDDECALALQKAIFEEDPGYEAAFARCRQNPLVQGRLAQEPGFDVDVDLALQNDVYEQVLRCTKRSQHVFTVHTVRAS